MTHDSKGVIGVLITPETHRELTERPTKEDQERWAFTRDFAARRIAKLSDQDGCIHEKEYEDVCDDCPCSMISGDELQGFCTMRQEFSK